MYDNTTPSGAISSSPMTMMRMNVPRRGVGGVGGGGETIPTTTRIGCGSSSPRRRRSSTLTLEGIDYDLSNLMLDSDSEEEDDHDQYMDGSNRSGGHNNNSHSQATCRSSPRAVAAALCDSPYRFDVQAMKALMISFGRDIPELNHSFRLSKEGQVLEVGHDINDHDEDYIVDGAHNGQGQFKPQQQQEDPLLFGDHGVQVPSTSPAPPTRATAGGGFSSKRCSVSSIHMPPGRCSVSTWGSVGDGGEEDQDYQDTGMDDLVYDPVKDTYVYKQDLNQEEPVQQQQQPVQSEQQQQVQQRYFTLEDVAASAANCDDQQDHPVGCYDEGEQHEMEISPGVYVPFRGAKETWQAVAAHSTVEVVCLDCCQVLVCIRDCEYTVCPDCRVVNPVMYVVERPGKSMPNKAFGVGMGFKQEWVRKKQIVNQQNEAALEAKTRRMTRRSAALSR